MAENEAEQKAVGGLVKKLLIFGGGGLVMIAVGLGAGWLIFGSAQPDPSEEIEEIIERKLAERETAEAEADNSTEPQKQSKDTPEEDVFETIYRNLPAPLRPIWTGHARCCSWALVYQHSMTTLS